MLALFALRGLHFPGLTVRQQEKFSLRLENEEEFSTIPAGI
jgi:hypothetical protein